ncbi:MAG TPA: serine protease [Planctomycetota bacterium]|nr:serine protease [Planctomycetota bacterium]
MSFAQKLLAALWLAAAALAGGVPGREPPLNFPDIVARVRCGIGVVGTYNPAKRPSLEFHASGFFLSDKGHFVTANHVLETIAQRKRLGDLRVFLPSDATRDGHRATVVATDARHDVALLLVEGGDFVPLELGDSARVREGQAIALTGFPFGFFLDLHPSTCVGIISSISPIALPMHGSRLPDAEMREALRSPFNVFQLDATANPGHSGGPLFDPETGKVLGVVNSGFIRKTKEQVISTGISYAMPIHLARPTLDEGLKAKPGLLPLKVGGQEPLRK